MVEFLLSLHNYEVDSVDSCGTTPLMDAVRAGHVKVRDFIGFNNSKCCLEKLKDGVHTDDQVVHFLS